MHCRHEIHRDSTGITVVQGDSGAPAISGLKRARMQISGQREAMTLLIYILRPGSRFLAGHDTDKCNPRQ